MPTELEREQAELQRLRASGNPAALHDADRLEKVYHVRQMDGLAQDVYRAAKGRDPNDKDQAQNHPPQGWTRLSEHPELVAQYAERLHETPRQLMETLHPNNSGFRAEIYIPDAALQQAGYKPTLAFKGSTGEVMTADGKRHDTSAEDFGANNFPQSIGLETDYYDRAMSLGVLLKRNGVDFESTGHSLAGGMAAAVAAVTDTQATTLNAAGLNPITTERFAKQHPGVTVSHDLNRLINNYQVQGELLSDGVQNNIHNMDALRRAELGATLQEACDVLRRVPEARDLFKQKLAEGLHEEHASYASGTISAFVDKVASGNADQLLRDLPLAAGEQHVLAAMTRDDQGKLMHRVQVPSLPETTRLATPLVESMAMVSTGVWLGERGGEVVAAGGRLEAQGLHAIGRGVDGAADAAGTFAQATTKVEGEAVQAGEYVAGAALAHARTAQAELAARVDEGLGQARQWGAEFDAAALRGLGHLVPDGLQHTLQAQAAHLQQEGRDAYRQGVADAAADRRAGQADAAAIRHATHTAETATGQVADAYGAAQHTVIGGAGHYARAGLDATAQGVEGTARHAPAAFGTVGGFAGLGIAGVLELNPENYPRLAEAAVALREGKRAGSEAIERHLLQATVTPSLDANIKALEKQANENLQRSVPTQGPTAAHPASVSDPNSMRYQQRALHGESSTVDRVQEAQRQQEIHGHAAAHEAPLPPAPAAIGIGARAPEREASPVRQEPRPVAREQDAPTHPSPRHEPSPTPATPDHAALAARQAQQQALHAQRHAQQERLDDRAAPTRAPGRLAEAAALAPAVAAAASASPRETSSARSETSPTKVAPPPHERAIQAPSSNMPAATVAASDPARAQPAMSAPTARPITPSEPSATVPHAAPIAATATPKLSPPLDPPALKDFRHPEHPLNPRYQMFRDALGEQGFHQDRPTLNAVPEVRGYSAEQKDRLAAGFTAQLGADTRYNTEIHHFAKDGDHLLAVERPRELGKPPLVLAVSQAQTLARTPTEHAAAWRARELPEPQAVNTARPDPRSLSPDHPGHPDHPRHAMFEHAREALIDQAHK